MRFIIPPQTIAEAKFRKFPVYEVFGTTAGTIAIAGLAVSGAGTAYAAYSSSESQKRNASLGKASAQAQAQVARYQNELNYKVAMAQAAQYENNAKSLNQFARNQEKQGVEQINRNVEQEVAFTSGVRAAYSSSGIVADSGSPLMVEAHNASQAQLSRMDSSYKTNLAAMDTDWKASLQRYQADMSREMAKQYEYGASMADWQGGPMADKAYNNAMQSANDTATAGYISATGSLLSAAGGMMKPSGSTGQGGYSSMASAQKAAPYASDFSYTAGMGYVPKAYQ
jgi:hypothetical protein